MARTIKAAVASQNTILKKKKKRRNIKDLELGACFNVTFTELISLK